MEMEKNGKTLMEMVNRNKKKNFKNPRHSLLPSTVLEAGGRQMEVTGESQYAAIYFYTAPTEHKPCL